MRYLIILLLALPTYAQQPQNPSPMVEHARAHPRLPQEAPAGRREKLELGTLFIPARLQTRKRLPLSAYLPVALIAFASAGFCPG